MAHDIIERLRYYQRQYLGADDFTDQQDYHLSMRRRHNLGPHTWGIVTGLELVELPKEGEADAVEIFVLPGFAVDGFGREIVMLAPHKLGDSLFEIYQGKGERVLSVWISYAEELAGRPRPGYEICDVDGQLGRIRETFRLWIEPEAPTSDDVTIAGRELTPGVGVVAEEDVESAYDLLGVPRDGSVPYQELPDDIDRPRWLVPLGRVRWNGSRLTADDEKLPQLTAGRHYAGLVGGEILAPAEELVVRGRKNPSPLPSDENDPHWAGVKLEVEGLVEAYRGAVIHDLLQVKALQGLTRLEVRSGSLQALMDQDGDDQNPAALDLQRAGGDLFVHRDNAGAEAAFLESGEVGIGTAEPKARLHVEGGTDAEVDEADSGHVIIGSTSAAHLALDARRLMARDSSGAAPLALQAGGGELTVHEELDEVRQVHVKGNGRVGVGTAQPDGMLHVTGGGILPGVDHDFVAGPAAEEHLAVRGNRLQGRDGASLAQLQLQRSGGDLLVHGALAGRQFVVKDDGDVGIGTASPAGRLQIVGGSSVHSGSAGAYLLLGPTDGTHLAMDHNEIQARSAGSETTLYLQYSGGDLQIHGTTGLDEIVRVSSDGKVGIGTATPRVKLHVMHGEDVALADDDGYLVLGDIDGLNVAFDDNEIQARNNGAPSALHLQALGGELRIHDQSPIPNSEVIIDADGRLGLGTLNPTQRLHVAGNVVANHYAVPSDSSLKRDIEDLGGSLSSVTALRGVRFRWKDSTDKSGGGAPEPGFVAQEVEAVFPEAVETAEDGTRLLKPFVLLPFFLEAIKELKSETDALASRLGAAPSGGGTGDGGTGGGTALTADEKRKLNALDKAVSGLGARLDELAAARESAHDELAGEVETLRSDGKVRSELVAGLEGGQSELRTAHDALAKEVESLRAALGEREAETAELRKALEEAGAERAALRETNQDLAADVEKLGGGQKALDDARRGMVDEIKQLRADQRQSDKLIKQLKAELDRLAKAVDERG